MADKKNFWSTGFGSFLDNMLFGLPSLIAGVVGSSRLTGAEREQNEFNASQAAIDRQFQAQQVEAANQFTAQQTQAQMDFQERMANTQYQRAVADMRAAGINPALAVGNGGAAAPSGAAGSGVAASGSAAAGSGRGMPFSMSEIMAALKMRKEMALLDAQRRNVDADTSRTNAQTAGQNLANEWNPKIWASEIGVRFGTLDKLKAEVDSILASTEGQRIYNEFSPALFRSQLDTAEIDRKQMVASIAKMQAEIDHYAVENEGIRADIGYKRALQVLTAAQTALTNMQTDKVSAEAWRENFENEFTREFGFKPDQPVWNVAAGVAGKACHLGGELIDKFFGIFGSGSNHTPPHQR